MSSLELCQRGTAKPIIDRLLFGTDVIVLQETLLADGEVAAARFHRFYNRRTK